MSEVLMIPGTDCPADPSITAGWRYTLHVWAAAHASQPAGDDAEAWLDWVEDGGDADVWYAAWRARNPGPDMEAIKAQALAAYHAQIERAPERHRLELEMRAERYRKYDRMVKRATTPAQQRATPTPTERPREQRAARGHTRARAPDDDGPSDPPPAEPQPAADVAAPSGNVEVLYRVVMAREAIQLADYGMAEAVLCDLEGELRSAA